MYTQLATTQQEQAAETCQRLRNLFESTFNQLDSEELDATVIHDMRTDLRDAQDEIGALLQELRLLTDLVA